MQPKLANKPRCFDWLAYLSDPQNADVSCVQVSSLPYSPLADIWNQLINDGLKVEVKNTDSNSNSDYWIASVIKKQGYYVRLRYEGFNDDSKDFWMAIFDPEIHPVGFCASMGRTLVPPASIANLRQAKDWRRFLQDQIVGACTLPDTFRDQLKESQVSRLKRGMKLEVVDKTRISAVRLAHVESIIAGRMHIRYEAGGDHLADDFWCHQNSLLIHPIGWAQLIGHELRATREYAIESRRKAIQASFDDNEAAWTLFPPVKRIPRVENVSGPTCFTQGMKLEAIDPLRLSTICVATVTKVLRCDYLMIGIDGVSSEDGSDWFCYHATSPCIFPPGFCKENNIQLYTPSSYKKEFDWDEYLQATESIAAPSYLFHREVPDHGIKEGDLLEAVDLMEPRLICVATVVRVVGRLLRIHFNGWEDNFDQWIDCESPDLYPAGWCAMVGYSLEPPKNSPGQYSTPVSESRHSRKKSSSRGRVSSSKRRKIATKVKEFAGLSESLDEDSDSRLSNTTAHSSIAMEESSVPVESTECSPLPADPYSWTVDDVEKFLVKNNFANLAQPFVDKKIDGSKLFKLTDQELNALTCKVGPALKIYALIQSLRGS